MQHAEKLNAAIRDCLRSCYLSSQPFHSLADYLRTLRHRCGWTEDEVHDVRSHVIRILRAVAEGEGNDVPLGLTLEARNPAISNDMEASHSEQQEDN